MSLDLAALFAKLVLAGLTLLGIGWGIWKLFNKLVDASIASGTERKGKEAAVETAKRVAQDGKDAQEVRQEVANMPDSAVRAELRDKWTRRPK